MELEFVAESAPTRVRIEARRTPDGVVKWWSECDLDAPDGSVGGTAAETTKRVLSRIHAPFGAKA